MVQEIKFDRERLANAKRLFPDEICDDPWVAFHGTSSVNEQDIDSQGFRNIPGIVTAEDVRRLCSVFDEMDWAGEHQGGYLVLKSHTVEDYDTAGCRPVYFAETSYRALLYATTDFAGGEVTRACRHGLDDLWNYLNTPAVRGRHAEEQTREREGLLALGASNVAHVTVVDLEWLRRQLDIMCTLQSRVQVNASHGVVYAARFEPSEIDICTASSWHGIRVHGILPKERIVAKTRIPPEITAELREDPDLLRASLRETGLLAVLEW